MYISLFSLFYNNDAAENKMLHDAQLFFAWRAENSLIYKKYRIARKPHLFGRGL
jgi:hypothetical protein